MSEPIREALLKVQEQLARTQAWMRAAGVVIDKWPPLAAGPGYTVKDHTDLTVEERWQGIAFTLYTDLVTVTETARYALIEGSDPASPPCKECGEAQAAPQHDPETILDPGTVGHEVHVYFPVREGSDPASPEAALDVERLARAWHEAFHGWKQTGGDGCSTDHQYVVRLAAEYARLAESPRG